MKLISKSLLGATTVYGIYQVTAFTVGYIKTMNYKPDFEAAWANVENLPNEVTFYSTTSPVLHAGAFLGTVLLCGVLFNAYEKVPSTSSKSKEKNRKQL